MTCIDQLEELLVDQKNNVLKLNLACLKSLNLTYSGNAEKGIMLLEDITNQKYQNDLVMDIHLSLAVFYFQQNKMKKAQNILTNFYHSDKWYQEKAGIDWLMKKNIVEILLHIELGNIDFAESRLKSFRRKFISYLNKKKDNQVITFLKFIQQYCNQPEIVTTPEFKQQVEQSFLWKTPDREDIL